MLASPITRMLAWLVDLAAIGVLTSILRSVIGLTVLVGIDFAVALSIIIYFVVTIGYSICLEWLWNGQTLGKRLLRLRVVDEGGHRLHFSQIAVRNLLRFVDSLPVFYFVGGVTALLNSRAQRMGDIAAGTIVVRQPCIGSPDIEEIAGGKYNSFSEHPYLDESRVGVVGHSYGGYYTIRALLQSPDVYAVGVASAPYDPRGDAVLPYMGLPQENPDGYDFASNIRLVNQLDGHLMIQHGSADDGALVLWTMQLVEAFVKAGKPVDLMIFPDQGHRLAGPSASYAEEARVRYLREHLQLGGANQGR